MTREEAIANLKTIMFAYIEPPPTKEQIKIINDTFDMAIKALEQEPFINKLCVSTEACKYDKNKVLDKIRAEIESEEKMTGAIEFLKAWKDVCKEAIFCNKCPVKKYCQGMVVESLSDKDITELVRSVMEQKRKAESEDK